METTPSQFAGFWKRVAAALIDSAILGIASAILIVPALAILGIGLMGDMEAIESYDEGYEPSGGLIAAFFGAYFFAIFVLWIGGWLYFALMEASSKQGTLGKMALGIKVTDMTGNRITFGRATGRYFGKILSSVILYIGFLMVGFTQQKQGLHDIIAGCLVVNK